MLWLVLNKVYQYFCDAIERGITQIAKSSFPIHRKLLENVKHPKYRSEHQLFVAEGYRIIREALEHGVTPAALYFTRLKLVAALKAAPSELKLEHVLALNDLPLFRAPYKTLQVWSSVTTSPGIVGQYIGFAALTGRHNLDSEQ